MRGRNFLEQLRAGVNTLQEFNAINDYKKKSELYKKVLIAQVKPGVDKDYKEKIDRLNKATTFAEMIKISKDLDPADQPAHIQLLARSAAFFGSFVNSNANLAYYAFQLHDDIVNYAVQNNFSCREMEDKKERSHSL